MLRVFDLNTKSIGVFDGYDAFLGLITSLENQNLLESGPSIGKGYWGFAYYTPSTLKHACSWIKPGFLTMPQLRALEQDLGLIEICRGDSGVLREIPVTPDLDVEEFKKRFCLDYCGHRGWCIIETSDHKPSPKVLAGMARYAAQPHTRKMRLSQMRLDNWQGNRLKSELDCCIRRLRQKPLSTPPTTLPPTTLTPKADPTPKGGF